MGLCVDIQPPDLETRIAILQMKSMRDRIDVPDDAMHLIAERFDSNIRELEGALLRVAAYASLSRRPVDLELATRALEDLMPPSAEEIPAAVILAETARYFGLTREELCSRSRSRQLTAARHVAMYLVRELTSLSLPKIGELFDRDHSTVMYGTGKIERQMSAREPTYRQVAELTRSIKDHARVSGNR
jgi:chromosomal replication initiator protein